MGFTFKQRISLAALAAFFVVVAATVFFWPKSKVQGYDQQTVAVLESVLPGVCRMQQKIELAQVAAASNLFWADVHAGAHLLAAKTDELYPELGNEFRISKAIVESDLATLDKSRLGNDVAKFAAVTRDALALVGSKHAKTTCEDLIQA